MAWALKFDGNNDYVSFFALSSTDAGSNINWYIETLSKGVSGEHQYLLGSASNSDNSIILRSTGNIDYRAAGVTTTFTSAVSDITAYNKIKIEMMWTGGNKVLSITVNDTPGASINISTASARPFTASGRISTFYKPSDVQYISYIDMNNAANSRYFDSTSSSHSAGAIVWTDISGNNDDASGFGFATDGSAWENLGGAGNDAAITSVMPALASSSSANHELPSFSASVSSVMPSLSSAASFAQSLPETGAVISSTLPSLVSASILSQNIPEFDNAIASTMPSMVSSAAIQSLTPDNNTSISSIMPSLTSNALLTIEEPVALNVSVASTMPSLQSSATIYNGVLSVVIGEGNNINVVVKSRDLNIDTLPRNLNIKTKSRVI